MVDVDDGDDEDDEDAFFFLLRSRYGASLQYKEGWPLYGFWIIIGGTQWMPEMICRRHTDQLFEREREGERERAL